MVAFFVNIFIKISTCI